MNRNIDRQAQERLEELAAQKEETVVEVSNEVPRNQNPIEIQMEFSPHFSGEPEIYFKKYCRRIYSLRLKLNLKAWLICLKWKNQQPNRKQLLMEQVI